ncbi:MAG: protein-glutamate O-methyltransferase CheR [Methanosarcinales archaeon]|nr:protein-glutamate O-methyltransferase CheR [Methanosarcinales archaeon]
MDDFEKLKDKISRDKHFSCSQYKDPYLKRRFAIRMRATGAKTYRSYIKILDTVPEEYQILLDVLTVNVTEFFRDVSVFTEVERVLRSIIKEKQAKKQNTLHIWSAGCSNGSEAYTITMLLDQILGPKTKDFKITILATDIDNASLKRGSDGIYDPNLLKGVKRSYLTKYFEKINGGQYQVIAPNRKIVTFKKHDLINDRPHAMMDVVFCRNVVIYFSRELQETLFANFYKSLVDGGYFVMGKTETLVGEAKDKFIPVSNKERIYRK